MSSTHRICAGILVLISAHFFVPHSIAQTIDLPQQTYNSSIQRTDVQLLAAGTILTLTALSTENAEEASSNLGNVVLLDGMMDVGNAYGSTWAVAGLTVGMGAWGYLGDSPRFRHAAFDLGKSLLITGAVVGLTKKAVDRTRPDNAGYSFPSGHTAVAFSAAPVLHRYSSTRRG
jgi:membrane-associated phospholipid phosphatase